MFIVLVHRGQHRILVTRDSRLGDLELMTQGWVKVLETHSHRVGELTNAYVVFTAVAAIAPLLIALGAYVSGYSGYSCLRGTTRQCTH